jgi:hypothetical protein
VEKKLPFKKANSGAGKAPAAGDSKAPADGKAPEAAAADAPAAGDGKTASRKGPVKAKAVSGKVKAKATAAAARPKRERKAPPPRTRGGIPFICSECYEEFVLPATYARETVTCPECLHVGKRPADNFLEKVNLHKTAEKRALTKSLIFAEMLVVGAVVLMWLLSAYSASTITSASTRGSAVMGVGAVVVVLIGLLAWSISQYEKNRWEIYF